MSRRILSLLVLACSLSAAEDGLLLHWPCDEGTGAVAKDASGQGLDGTVGGTWTTSGSGQAVVCDGTPKAVIRVMLPEGRRLGTGSWTFMVWYKPIQLDIASKQNQRRLFSYGPYPKAFIGIDLTGAGGASLYQCYQPDGGRIVGTGVGVNDGLTVGAWTHLAMTCDRATGIMQVLTNGRLRGEQRLPADFAGDYSAAAELTVGSGWQNIHGVVDEARLYRRALPRDEVKREFLRLKDAFKVVPSAADRMADRQEACEQALVAADLAWTRKDWPGVRTALAPIIAETALPAHYRSHAHLRLAQSHNAEGRPDAARGVFATIAATADYPPLHREEAGECQREAERLAKGLPARDPEATRVRLPAAPAPGRVLHVAPDGDDAHSGTEQQPFATVAKALAANRAAGVAAGGTAILLAPGTYPIASTIALTRADSGTAEAPLTIRAKVPGKAVLYGGRRLTGFAPVTDAAVRQRLPGEAQGTVVQCDLKALGITDYGRLTVRGFGQPASPPTVELYVDHKAQTLARWPNEGFVKPAKLVEPGDRKAGKPSVLAFDDERHARWTQADDAWLFGYFHFLWADATIRIGRIDPAAKTITTAAAYEYGGRGMDAKQGIIYHAFNLLEEIDRPGEWYLDRRQGVLYWYPTCDPAAATIELSLLSEPMFAAQGVSHVRLEGLVFDCARFNGVELKDANDCLVAGCTIRRMAGNGISILGGRRNTLLGCDLHTMGRRASEVIGGERETLTPGAHVVANCRFRDFGRIDRTYTPAIQLEGVGNRVAHNLFLDCPSSVMRLEGNDHVVEYNESRDVLRESDDQGAMELFGNPTYRGVVFRFNRFTRIGAANVAARAHGQAGIRFDDAISGMLVYGNIFHRAAAGSFGGVQINSGRDNLMDNNLFIDCPIAVSGGYGAGNHVWKEAQSAKPPKAHIMNDLYRARYPAMARMFAQPGLNCVWRNALIRCERELKGNPAGYDRFANVIRSEDPGFLAGDDLKPRIDTALFLALGLRPIPVEEIGLYDDAARQAWHEQKPRP